MNRGLLFKGLRETWVLTVVCALGAFVFETLVSYLFWSYQEQFTNEILEMDFVRQIIEALVGAEMGDSVTFGALTSLAWVHPMFLSILFAHAITTCTRMPAGEIDRGTIDVLLGIPLSRFAIFRAETVVWKLSGAFVILGGLGGSMLGHAFIPPESRPETFRVLLVLANLYALYAVVAAFSSLVSVLNDRRGRAVGIVFGVVLAHLVWNFLGQYWSVAERFSFLGVLHYFKPLPILGEGLLPLRNVAVLVTLAVALWTIGALMFNRRDIHTV